MFRRRLYSSENIPHKQGPILTRMTTAGMRIREGARGLSIDPSSLFPRSVVQPLGAFTLSPAPPACFHWLSVSLWNETLLIDADDITDRVEKTRCLLPRFGPIQLSSMCFDVSIVAAKTIRYLLPDLSFYQHAE